MKKFLVITGLVIFSIAITGFGFEKKHIEPADTIRYIDKGNIYEYEMVEEIDLGGDVYKVWFGKDSGYPRLVKYHGKVIKQGMVRKPDMVLYNSNFKKIREMVISRVYPSPRLEYIGLTKCLKSPTTSEKGKMKLILLDENGNKIWEKEYATGYDYSGPYYFVSDKGEVVEYDNSLGKLTFYGIKGDEIKKIQLFKKGYWDEGRNVRGKFSGDGNYFAINLEDPDEEIFSNGTGVILFSERGKELWRFETEGNRVSSIYISREGSYIIASSCIIGTGDLDFYHTIEASTYLFDKTGYLIRKYPGVFIGIWFGEFSPSEDYVIINDVEHERAYIIDTKTGDRLFKYSLLGTGKHLRNVQVAEEGNLIGITYHNKVELIQFNGVKAWSKEIPNPENLWLSNDGSRFTVRTKNKALRFERIK